MRQRLGLRGCSDQLRLRHLQLRHLKHPHWQKHCHATALSVHRQMLLWGFLQLLWLERQVLVWPWREVERRLWLRRAPNDLRVQRDVSVQRQRLLQQVWPLTHFYHRLLLAKKNNCFVLGIKVPGHIPKQQTQTSMVWVKNLTFLQQSLIVKVNRVELSEWPDLC